MARHDIERDDEERTKGRQDRESPPSPEKRNAAPGQKWSTLQRSLGNAALGRILQDGTGAARKGEAEALAEQDQIVPAQGFAREIDAETSSPTAGGAGSVRLHAGPPADRLARGLDAVAFTTGRDIFLSDDALNRGDAAAVETLAHELAHARTAPQGVRRQGRRQGQGQEGQQAPQESDGYTATNVMGVAADILRLEAPRFGQVESAPQRFKSALEQLYYAKTGVRGNRSVPGAERLDLFEAAMAALRPAMATLEEDPDQKTWLDSQVTPYAERLRQNLNYAKAQERVENAAIGPGNQVMEMPGAADARGQAAVLHAQIPTLVQTLGRLNEQLVRFGHEDVHHALHHWEKAREAQDKVQAAERAGTLENLPNAEELIREAEKTQIPPQVKKGWGDTGLLVELQSILLLADGMLTLSDEELAKELSHPKGVFQGISSYAEFVKGVIEIIGGTIGVAGTLGWVIARVATTLGGAAASDLEYAAQSMALSRGVGLALANIVAAIEVVHGVAVLLDSHASAEKKVEAVRDIGVGGAWLAGSVLEKAGVAGAGTVGMAVSISILATYYEIEIMADLYGSALTGIVGGWMSLAFQTMAEDGRRIAADGKELAKAGMLLAAEKDPAQSIALGRVVAENARRLGSTVDYFLEKCEPAGYGPGAAYKPGAFTNLRREFAPLLKLQGRTAPDEVAPATLAVLKKIQWCLEHAAELVREAVGLEPAAAAAEGEER